jgi:sugar-specific transcriptional regulator TrmB
MSIENQIITYLKNHTEETVNELQEQIGVSRQRLHRVLNRMIEQGYLQKLGRPPKVFYRLNLASAIKATLFSLPEDEINFLNEHFLLITETGNRLEGVDAMRAWCEKQKLPVEKTVREFITTKKKYLNYFLPNGLINGTEKLRNTKGFDSIAIDELFYCDFYAIERFGKTKLGTLLHYAKQGQNRPLMQEIISLTKNKLEVLIKEKKIEAIGYIPPTIKRHLQIMTAFQKGYNLSLPHLNIVKVSGMIPVPQKALSKLEDRIKNASASIMIKDTRQFKNILLIDDAVGSGATINETAAKLKKKGTAKKVFGLAITGSFKGFDVIQEV